MGATRSTGAVKRPSLLVLALATLLLLLGLWTRSYTATYLLGRWMRSAQGGTVRETCSGVFSHRGALGVASYASEQSAAELGAFTPLSRWGWIGDAPAYPIGERDAMSLAGFDYVRELTGSSDSTLVESRHLLRVPYWVLALLVSLVPLWHGQIAIRRRLALRRERMRGLCPACGYDLRATPARCPECGIVTRSSGAAA